MRGSIEGADALKSKTYLFAALVAAWVSGDDTFNPLLRIFAGIMLLILLITLAAYTIKPRS